ncbi:hypothetical protein FKW31_06250 [Acetobacter sp. DmW_136]|nr:hypothetical protein FKW31_06250 [Acetobacter sp. DmW_136]
MRLITFPFVSYVFPALCFRHKKSHPSGWLFFCLFRRIRMVAGNRTLRSRRNVANGHSQASLVAGARKHRCQHSLQAVI